MISKVYEQYFYVVVYQHKPYNSNEHIITHFFPAVTANCHTLQTVIAVGAVRAPTEVICCFLAFASNKVQQKFWCRLDVCFY